MELFCILVITSLVQTTILVMECIGVQRNFLQCSYSVAKRMPNMTTAAILKDYDW